MRLRTFGGLWIEGLSADADGGPRPRALALLALLAASEGKGVSRDRILGVLWPDSDAERARHAMSQTLYSLRRTLGVDVVLSTPELRLDSSLLTSDLQEFRAAVRGKTWSDTSALYAGPFLEGFYLADAPEFERWVESERAALATAAIRAIESLAVEKGRTHKKDALDHWRRLTRLDPANSRYAVSYMEALEERGERAAALAHGRTHAELLRSEFDAQPDPLVERIMNRLRSDPAHIVMSGEYRADASSRAPASAARGSRKPAVLAAVAVLLVVSVVIGWRSARTRDAATPVVAVGRIRDLVAPESTAVSAVLSEMLATSLSRINDLHVIANSRMLELTPRNADTSRSAHEDAARRAGATEIIEGELLPIADRRLRLAIRRVDLRRGIVRGGYVVTGSDRIALFDSVTALVASDFRFRAPVGSLASVSTGSPIAYRFYEEGLRAFYQFDNPAANRLLRAAVREDSAFAMAAYYAWRAAVAAGDGDQVELSERASTLASRATARDRLLIATHVGYVRGDLRAMSAAETLATKYSRDPEALIRSAEVMRDLPRAIELLNRSIALDSAAGQAPTALCRLCDAFNLLIERYRWADSTETAERTVRRWMALRPRDVKPWALLSEHYTGVGRYNDASVALRRYEALGGSRTNVHLDQLVQALRADDVDATNTRCAEGLSGADSAKFVEYRWYCTIGLRMQGRYREARALVHEGRVPKSTIVRRGMAHDSFHAAILDMEMGHALAAVDEFREVFPVRRDSLRVPAGVRARQRVWVLTLTATAAVAGGDTARARMLVDSIQSVGSRSLYGRDQLLHHFIRGLLLARGGHDAQAIREYRNAMFSPTFGYTRVNYELGQSLLKLNRAGEAIPVVRAALHGGIEGSNLYITRTELHELLARAFDANAQRDSAAAHYTIVEHVWRHADPAFAQRHRVAQRRLGAVAASSR